MTMRALPFLAWIRRDRSAPWLSAALLALAGCMAPAPKIFVETSHGEVRAETEHLAAEAAEELDRLFPRVVQRIPDSRHGKVEVWVQREIQVSPFWTPPEDLLGLHLQAFLTVGGSLGRIHLRADRPPTTMGHELAHALLGESWKPLPGVLVEGLCDAVALDVLEAEGAEEKVRMRVESATVAGVGLQVIAPHPFFQNPHRPMRRIGALHFESLPVGALADALDIASDDLLNAEFEQMRAPLYSLGFFLVQDLLEEIGVNGLRLLCVRAMQEGHDVVPAGWILERLELPPDWDLPESRAYFASFLGEPELRFAADRYADSLSEVLCAYRRREFPHWTMEQFLARVQPEVRFEYGRHTIPVAELPELQECLVDHY